MLHLKIHWIRKWFSALQMLFHHGCWWRGYRHVVTCSIHHSNELTEESLKTPKQHGIIYMYKLHTFLCEETKASVRMLTTKSKDCRPWVALDPLSAYFFVYPYDWKHLLKGIVERVSMMGVLGTQGGFALALFQGWRGRVKNCWKMCSYNFSF